MKKPILAVILMLCTLAGAQAQILWKISGNGLTRPSYLLGTHHVAPVALLDTLPSFGDILGEVDMVCGEMVMSEAMSPRGQQVMAMAAMAPADSTLSILLSPQQMDSLTAVLQKYMGPAASATAFDALKPSMVATVLAMAQTRAAFPDLDPSEQLDTEVQTRALALGKKVEGLETVDEQCAVLFGGSIASQAADLLDMVRNDGYSLSMARKLAKAYMDGDLNAILAVMEDPAMTTPEATDRLINRRNADWLRVLLSLLPTASVLIAVGAGHLPGDNGLISLFRKEGYTVEEIR